MMKKLMLTLGTLSLLAFGAKAQKSPAPCGTDEFHRAQIALHPELAEEEARFNAIIEQAMKGQGAAATGSTAKTAKTAGDSLDAAVPWPDDVTDYDIPVVIHVIYDYGVSSAFPVTDNDIYDFMVRLNNYYNLRYSTTGIIAPFKPYLGNAHFTFHLANKDPQGKPTRGIVRTYSYQASGGDEAAKIDQWPPDQYVNIYFENFIAKAGAGAYATFPSDYSTNPYSQGIISVASQALTLSSAKFTIAHELGHFFFLYHVWNSNGKGADEMPYVCGDDQVDDTPPTHGHINCGTTELYDTMCATGYMKIYDTVTSYHMFKDKSSASTLKDYPDTVNSQNIMDYSFCNDEMFTKGQVARMRAAIRSNVGNRFKLKTEANLIRTGIKDANGQFLPSMDMTPTALYSVARDRNFTCRGSSVTFTNRSYNDTIGSANWTFNKTTTPNYTQILSVTPTFNDTGWITASLTVSGNGAGASGSNTYTRNDLVYVADENGMSPYIEEFSPSNQLGKFPIFNYFDNPNYRWEYVNNAGFYDKTSIRFKNYDPRDQVSVNSGVALNTASQSPRGLYADFFTPGYNLADGQFANKCFLSFFSAGAARTTKPNEMNDSMMISYSTNCGQSWNNLPAGKLKYGALSNNGYHDDAFVPGGFGEWKEQSIPIPTNARGATTYFRFRYWPGTDNAFRFSGLDFGTGNNFYIDRLSVTNAPLGVENGVIVKLGMSVRPNPTSGAATIRLNGGDNSVAEVNVTDVTGKLVFRTSAVRAATTTEIVIPATSIAVKGMYLVHVVTNGATETQKLVVY